MSLISIESALTQTPIPLFPAWAPISLASERELYPALHQANDGISEFTFSNLYLFRHHYHYELSALEGGGYVVRGERDGERFFSTPFGCPPADVLAELARNNDYWKNISEPILRDNAPAIEAAGFSPIPDRDNFDYLYSRTDLANLSGKKFHKKRNLVNAFMLAYPEHTQAPLTRERVAEAEAVLEVWRIDKVNEGDYEAASEALELFDTLHLEGTMFYVRGKPAGWCMGETLAGGSMFAVHFEKGVDAFKGIYQFINQQCAANLDESITYINREQDLGDAGMRQAKETYRPVGFVKKWYGKKG
jgi:hypothetical protein